MNTTLIISLTLALALPAISTAQDLFTYHAGRKLALTPKPDHVMIKLTDASQVLAKPDLGEAQVEHSSGWAKLTEPSKVRSMTASTAVRLRVTEVLQRADVAFVSPVFDTGDGTEMTPSQSIVVKVKPGVDLTVLLQRLNNSAITSARALGSNGTFVLNTNLRDGARVLDLANQLALHPGLAIAQPDFRRVQWCDMVPMDPGFTDQGSWGLRQLASFGGISGFDMDADWAWDVTAGHSSVIVAVFDGGVQQNHPEINQIPGRDFTDEPVRNGGTRRNMDGQWHGTAVASCISGKMNNAFAACGVAPNVKVVSVRWSIPRLLDGRVALESQDSWLIEGLDWAQSIGARITVHSYGGGWPSWGADDKFAETRRQGMIHFASTGNDADVSDFERNARIHWPAASPSVLGVGAANKDGGRASFSQWKNSRARAADSVDFLAPGHFVMCAVDTDVSDEPAILSGTSFAAPYAAGVAALMLSQDPFLTPDQIESRMIIGCRDMDVTGYDKKTGFGMVNALRSLKDDHGDTTSTATSMGFWTSRSGFFSSASDKDIFKVVVLEFSVVRAQVTGPTAAAVALLNASGTVIASANGQATHLLNFNTVTNPLLEAHLAPGTYFIRVSRNEEEGVIYTLNTERLNEYPEIEVFGNGVEIFSGDTTPSSTDGTILGSGSRTFTIKNTGRNVLRISNRSNIDNFSLPNITPPTPGAGPGPIVNPDDFVNHFSLTTLPAADVQPGMSTTFTIKYGANDFNNRTRVLKIRTNDENEREFTFTVSGVNVPTPRRP